MYTPVVNTTDSAGRVAGNTDRIPVRGTDLYLRTSSTDHIAANIADIESRPSNSKDHKLVPVHCY